MTFLRLGINELGTHLMEIRILLALTLLSALVPGCESDPDRTTSAKFGDSVRNTIALQTASPTTTGPALDGVRAQQTLNAYRLDVATRRNVEKPMMITIGSGK
jgi:hypothetical protein